MAELGTLAVNADVAEEAGSGANATYTAEAYTNKYIKKAEGLICLETRYDWVTNYASVSDIGKEALRLATACLAAISCIDADMSGYTSRQEALIMQNTLWAKYREVVSLLLKDDKYKEFILSGVGDIE
jgi:hypothetical protein